MSLQGFRRRRKEWVLGVELAKNDKLQKMLALRIICPINCQCVYTVTWTTVDLFSIVIENKLTLTHCTYLQAQE